MSLTSAAPLLVLLNEKDNNIKSYALQSINEVIDAEWSEVSNYISNIEALSDETTFEGHKMAALVASKVYYNLGEYNLAVRFALAAEDCFDINEKSQYVETIVSKSIEMYIQQQTRNNVEEDTNIQIEPKLTSIFERMLDKCVSASEFKLALGIALEGYRLDIVERILESRIAEDTETNSLKLLNYVLTTTSTTISNSTFRTKILKSLFKLILSMKNIDYFTASKVVVNLNELEYAVELFESLKANDCKSISYQIAFDLVSSGSQGLLTSLMKDLNSKGFDPVLLNILSGLTTCDYYNTFLHQNKNIDIGLLNKTKSSLDGKFSLFHTGVSVANGFMHAGTTDNSFIKANLPWLGKAQNWAKFTATASLGVIHKGNLTEGQKVMGPYLPGSRASSRYIKGGSLYGLGLLNAGFGANILSYLLNIIEENAGTVGDEDVDVLLHGASLGAGLAAMGSHNTYAYETLREVIFHDTATSGDAAALGIGLTMLGSGDQDCTENMSAFAHETNHGNIKRSLALSVALINYGCQEKADIWIEKLLEDEDSTIRYGGAFTIALAYVGTSNNGAVKKLLHIAVSDSNDDVRRAAVISLGFVLCRDYTTVPRIVELLSKSHNAHVRCGTALALGIACAGRALDEALDVLEPLAKDPVDYVRQAAFIAQAMITIHQTDKSNQRVTEINKNFLSVVTGKHQEALAKFGACIAQGIANAGGRNVTIQLENNETGTLDTKSIIGLVMFTQFWYWYPLAHFLSLSFTPTAVIAVRETDLAIPKVELNCFAKEVVFDYPKMYEEEANKEIEKVATAVLSTTARAKARAKKTKKDKDEKEDKEEKTTTTEQETTEETKISSTEASSDEYSKNKYSAKPYKIQNLTRVLPQQSRYVSFVKNGRFTPVRKLKNTAGIIVVSDSKPDEPIELIETIRERNNVNAPMPPPFYVTDEIDFDNLHD